MKHCRDVIKRPKEELPGIEITRLRQKKYAVYELKLGVAVRHLTVSVSQRTTTTPCSAQCEKPSA